MNGLRPPHEQLGFFWRDQPSAESYKRALRWLVDDGYQLSGNVLTMKAVDGRLPRFPQLALHGRPPGDVIEQSNWTVDDALTSDVWLPVLTRLVPTKKNQVQLELGYAMIEERFFKYGGNRPVEVVMAGADLDLVYNVGASSLGSAVVRRPKRTELCRDRIFGGICDDLRCDYASNRTEWFLASPKSLVASRDRLDFDKLLLSRSIVGPDEARSALLAAPVLSAEFREYGTFWCFDQKQEIGAIMQGVHLIRGWIERWI